MSKAKFFLTEGSAQQFVEALLMDVSTHTALNHPYLVRLASGDLPDVDEALRDYAFNYSHYSKDFVHYLEGVVSRIENVKHQQLIRENLLEEEGEPGAKALEDRPHVEIFENFKHRIGIDDKYQVKSELCKSVRHWRTSFLSYCNDEDLGVGLGAIGLGTEHIVPTIYPYFVEAITKHSTFDDKTSLFFDLHVECDDGHGDDLLWVTEQFVECQFNRADVFLGTTMALDLRSQFWDEMLSRALKMPSKGRQFVMDEKHVA